MANSFYSQTELKNLGFKSLGENVLISKKASIYGAQRIALGNNIRIDDFCVISAGSKGITIGDYVHIAVFCSLQGEEEIILHNFSGLSSRVAIYSSNDDYSGESLTQPTVDDEFRNVTSAKVILMKHVLIGSGSIILPGVTMQTGSATGAMTLVNSDCEEFTIYAGCPAQKLKKRKKNLIDLEKEFLSRKL